MNGRVSFPAVGVLINLTRRNGWPDFERLHEHHIDVIRTLVPTHDDRDPAAGRVRDEIGIGNVNPRAVR